MLVETVIEIRQNPISKKIYIYIYNIYIYIYIYIFSIRVFFHEHSRITGLQGKGEGISLTPHYHFHPLHRHLDISRIIAAEISPLHIASSRTRTGNLGFPKPLISKRKLLTAKLTWSVKYLF